MMKLSLATLLAVSLVATEIPVLAQGQRIQPKDGDALIIEDGARVKMIRRSNATVRTIFNPGQHWLVILVDSAMPGGRPPDGRVDASYTLNDVSGDWPLGERWEGAAVVDDYSTVGEMGIVGVGLSTPAGVVQLLSPRGGSVFRDQAATLVLSYGGAGRSGGGGDSFAQAEEYHVGIAMRNAAHIPPPGSSISMSVRGSASGGVVGSALGGLEGSPGPPPPPPMIGGPVRVGGSIRTPRRIVTAAPVMPDAARQAGVTGVVILEIVIAPDGSVGDVKILRSIPLLNQAAIDTVRQWRFEPTMLNGAPVPVIITVTVNFQ
jgi:TonB family protein